MIIVFAILRAGPNPKALAAAITVLCAACDSPSPIMERNQEPARHVLVVVIDTLRADHLPVYGYDRDTAPFLSELAGSGTVFTNAISPSSFTAESVSTLFTGRYPSQTSWGAGWYSRPAPDATTLAMRFQEAGYATAFFSNSPVLDEPEFYRGFDTTWCGTEFGVSGQAPRLVERATQWLDAHREEPTFTYLHFLDPHGPYAPPPEFRQRFGDAPPPNALGLYDDVRQEVPALRAEGFGPGESRFDDLVARYDAEIAIVDDNLRALFEALKDLGMDRELLAVITADHGEEFLEHGFVEHAWTVYPETYRVPLIFWQPGTLPAGREAGVVSLVDVMPTLLQLQELPPVDPANGSALFKHTSAATWRPVSPGEPRLLEMLIQSRCLVRGVVTDNTLYLAYWKWLTPAERAETAGNLRTIRSALLAGNQAPVPVWGPIVREELYDLERDPNTTRNLAEERTEEVARWRAYLRDYQQSCPPQLPDRFKAVRDVDLLTPAERELLQDVPGAFLQPRQPEGVHEEALKSLGYL